MVFSSDPVPITMVDGFPLVPPLFAFWAGAHLACT
jgi:hypothetical protein